MRLVSLSNVHFTRSKFLIIISAFFTLGYNYSFFYNVLNVYSLRQYWAQILSLLIILFLVNNILLNILINRYTMRWLLPVIFILASMASYIMDLYLVVIDAKMIDNIFQTNLREEKDYFTLGMIAYIILLGIIPALFSNIVKIDYLDWLKEFISKVKIVVGSFLVIIGLVFLSSKFFTSFLREHKPMRYYANPPFWIYSIGKYASMNTHTKKVAFTHIGEDAVSGYDNKSRRKLVVMVVGESARADHLSINGYKQKTNPRLEKEKVISFNNVTACGTSTSVSVPCMFSHLTKNNFNENKARNTENVLDVLKRSHVNILWRDNNSDSKGVAARIDYEDFMTETKNPICDPECRDMGMLIGLQEYITSKKNSDILIILHLMGNHGPAYYKRYPSEFEIFKPACKSQELRGCTDEEIVNAYDNIIVYTDYLLFSVIELLKANSNDYQAALFYMSDHGESLGEKSIYLHALPPIIAPREQLNVATIFWFNDEMKKVYDFEKLKKISKEEYSHDNVFHTIVGLFGVTTSVYNRNLDMFLRARKQNK